ncbi:hypothetical protein FOL47_004167 [Perkinsus chesapeaki]|uniref:EF-hand domain-containing protein n=1 Tax=Perkinsus chesapeaki TaxID=330153 RepID=A0A7J6M474_PERCH|nr:hypothetical protein FOL47_004167 [Perkinsus chesapeaki]
MSKKNKENLWLLRGIQWKEESDGEVVDHSAELAMVDVFAAVTIVLICHQIWKMVPGFLYYFTPATSTELMKRANIISETVEKEWRVKRLRFLHLLRALRNKVVLDEARDAILASRLEGRPSPERNKARDSLFELAGQSSPKTDDDFDSVIKHRSAVDRMASRMRRSTRMSRRLHVPGVTELVFKLYDIDRNGRLQKDELRRAIIAQGIDREDAEVVLSDWVDIFDVDGDGCLDLREFKNLMAVLDYLESSFDAPACRKWLSRVFQISDGCEEITSKVFRKGVYEKLGAPLGEAEVMEFFHAVVRADPSNSESVQKEAKVSLSALSWWIERFSGEVAGDYILVKNDTTEELEETKTSRKGWTDAIVDSYSRLKEKWSLR